METGLGKKRDQQAQRTKNLPKIEYFLLLGVCVCVGICADIAMSMHNLLHPASPFHTAA